MSNDTPGPNTTVPTVHILAQAIWHSPAAIIGNADGLRALRDAIDVALSREIASVKVFADDGEGYSIAVVRRHDMSDAPYGYTDEICGGRQRSPRWLLEAMHAR